MSCLFFSRKHHIVIDEIKLSPSYFEDVKEKVIDGVSDEDAEGVYDSMFHTEEIVEAINHTTSFSELFLCLSS